MKRERSSDQLPRDETAGLAVGSPRSRVERLCDDGHVTGNGAGVGYARKGYGDVPLIESEKVRTAIQ
jgi:hypothetical protein